MVKHSQIKIIGTSHIARQSVNELRKNIRELKPKVVAVELDQSRYHGLFSKKRRLRFKDIRALGMFGFFFAMVGSLLQKYLGEKVGMAPGSDMKVAIVEARKIGATVALIDRDIRITVHRLSIKVPLTEKLKLVGFLLVGWMMPSERRRIKNLDLKKVPEEDVLEEVIAQLKNKFPKLYTVLVKERDAYMARNIMHLKTQFPAEQILVVVGAGHKKGLGKILNK